MKGLTHFISGVAAASFIPLVSRMSISSRMDIEGAISSFILVLAGMYGILPDTLDFKFGQFFEMPDIVIDPDPVVPDPQAMAEAFAGAVDRAAETGREIKVQFFPTQLGANRWRQYCIVFEKSRVSIQFNEVVSTSQIPLPGTAPESMRVGSAVFGYELKPYSDDVDWLNRFVRYVRQKIKGKDDKAEVVKPSMIDILSSTMFGLKPEKDGRVYFNWLPWHRTWSHSYVVGAILSIPVLIAAYLLKLPAFWLYGLVAFIGFAVHVTEDMTGHIGGSLLWPLLKPRTEGLELFKASDPRTNFSVIYTAVVMIIWNLDRFTTQYIQMPGRYYMFWFLIIPLALYFGAVEIIRMHIEFKKEDSMEEPDGTGDAMID